MDGKQKLPWERGDRGEGIMAPIEATPQKDLRKIQGGTTRTITDYNNGTQKIEFIPCKADMDIDIPPMKQKTRKRKGNCKFCGSPITQTQPFLTPPKIVIFFTSPCQGSDLSSLGRLIMKKDGLSDDVAVANFPRGAAQ